MLDLEALFSSGGVGVSFAVVDALDGLDPEVAGGCVVSGGFLVVCFVQEVEEFWSKGVWYVVVFVFVIVFVVFIIIIVEKDIFGGIWFGYNFLWRIGFLFLLVLRFRFLPVIRF